MLTAFAILKWVALTLMQPSNFKRHGKRKNNRIIYVPASEKFKEWYQKYNDQSRYKGKKGKVEIPAFRNRSLEI